MVIILTTIRYPMSSAQQINEVVTSDVWNKLFDPAESNLGVWTGGLSDLKGVKWVWMKRIERDTFIVNYTGTARRAMYLCSLVEGANYKIEILTEDPELQEEVQKWSEIIGQ